jgi:competence protein ComEA
VQQLREKLLTALSSSQSVNRRLVLLVFLFVAAVSAILISLNSPKPYQTADAVEVADQPPAQIIQAPTVFVHVVGEVANPGIYSVDAGGRVFDAIFAAGGFTELADQASVNLAREVSDGEQVLILTTGQAAAPGSAKASQLLSLNRASQAELEQLPGVGPTLAGRMLDWRTANGGFKKKEDLMKVSGIGPKLFASMKDLVTL